MNIESLWETRQWLDLASGRFGPGVIVPSFLKISVDANLSMLWYPPENHTPFKRWKSEEIFVLNSKSDYYYTQSKIILIKKLVLKDIKIKDLET